ncbi:hypothetical protein N658DRAFT_259363 [Parathielavia hyrcaniae]|uniref:Uncharacterized protein n=1 Tax=Parathielavia hyrcaniae TaxID=113614 RepID=A0AAN6PU62_9PEZI|nr:hypothetical protein N658DRAFT_259363 [Parathielavia hyrcaniae]
MLGPKESVIETEQSADLKLDPSQDATKMVEDNGSGSRHGHGISHEVASNTGDDWNDSDDSDSSNLSSHSREDSSPMIYESEEYFSRLIQDEERNPQWQSRKPSSPLDKASFLWNLSMGHILDGLGHEYERITESGTTDGKQLGRIRKLFEGGLFLVLFSLQKSPVAREFRVSVLSTYTSWVVS